MNNFIFDNSTKVIFGKGCVREHLPEILKQYGHTVMLAYGGGSIKKNGVYDEVTGILAAAGKQIVEFSGIMPNPTYAKVQEGAALARRENVELILAVGGGSVMDCSKAVSLAARYDGDAWNDFWRYQGIVDFSPVPVCVIVTASGTGSEVNGEGVITNTQTKEKLGRDYHACNARAAFMDPVYTFSLPKRQMISGGFDSLSHMMEIYFGAPDEPNVSDDLNEALMCGVIRDLRAAIQDPRDYTARSNLMWESTMAENRIIKMGKNTDFECHMMEHQLGAYTNCNHGEGLSVLHPVYYRHIYRDGLNKFAQFAEHVWGISPDGKSKEDLALAGIDALSDFIREIGMPTRLREIGIDESVDLQKIADSCEINHGGYRALTHTEILEIFRECL